MICNGNSNDCNERDDEIINKGCCALIAGPIKNKGSLRAFDLFLFLLLSASHVENHISLDFLQIFFLEIFKTKHLFKFIYIESIQDTGDLNTIFKANV